MELELYVAEAAYGGLLCLAGGGNYEVDAVASRSVVSAHSELIPSQSAYPHSPNPIPINRSSNVFTADVSSHGSIRPRAVLTSFVNRAERIRAASNAPSPIRRVASSTSPDSRRAVPKRSVQYARRG
jgi:hypothetical protein